MATETDTCMQFAAPKLPAAGRDSDSYSIAIFVTL